MTRLPKRSPKATKDVPTSWGKFAEWYDELLGEAGTYQKELILPNLLRLMGITKGMRILDLACGQGFFAREFAAAGALVTGVDVSPELIAIAREKSSADITFHVAPSHQFKAVGFDAVAIILAIQNIEVFAETFSVAAKALSAGGRLYLVMTHPAFRVPKRSSWGWDESARLQYRRIDGYLGEAKVPIQMHPGDAPSARTITFHRPLQSYSKALQKAGFAISRLEEWNSHRTSQAGPRKAAEDRARKEIPLFLAIEAVKLA
jgi:ubiquinone/menaquinone biosynthesis C-methylase UbiE